MKLYCSGLDLSEAVFKVSKAMPIKKTIPILEGIKLSAKGNILTITATDLELAIEKKIQADIKIEGEVVVPGKFFSEFLKKLASEQIELVTVDNTLKVKYMDSVGEMQCLNIDEFPPIRNIEEGTSFSIIEKEFKELLNKTIFSAATEDLRPILKGCLLEIEEYKITAVALDGFRLAICKKALEKKASPISVVVPARSLNEISKLLEDDQNIANVYIEKNYIMIEVSDTRITSRLIEGDYIKYKKIIPSEFASTVIINKQQMETGLERASLVSRGDKNNLVKFDIKEKILSITSNSSIGKIKENVTISLTGKDIAIAFNARYFTEALRVIDDEFIRITISTSTAPCIVRPVDNEDFLYLILPVKMLG